MTCICPNCKATQDVPAMATAYQCRTCQSRFGLLTCPGCSLKLIFDQSWQSVRCGNCGQTTPLRGSSVQVQGGPVPQKTTARRTNPARVTLGLLIIVFLVVVGIKAVHFFSPSPHVEASVTTSDVLGSYSATVSNFTGSEASFSCNVQIIDDAGSEIGDDSFSIGPIPDGQTDYYDGKAALSGPTFADRAAIDCS